MYNSFKKNSKAYQYLEQLKNDASSLQRLYIPKLTETIIRLDPKSAEVFIKRIQKFKPRLVMNMIENPKDADRAMKIRRSCTEYLGLTMDYSKDMTKAAFELSARWQQPLMLRTTTRVNHMPAPGCLRQKLRPKSPTR